MDLKLENLDKVLARLAQVGADSATELASAMLTESELIITEAKKRTPVDTGALRSSGHVRSPKISGGEVDIEMGFGGPAVNYAVRVHEDLNANHPVGQAKFLESVVVERRPTISRRVAKRLIGRVGK